MRESTWTQHGPADHAQGQKLEHAIIMFTESGVILRAFYEAFIEAGLRVRRISFFEERDVSLWEARLTGTLAYPLNMT
jgi:hypothetical protein